MAGNYSFQASGNSFTLTTSGVASTSTSVPVTFASLGCTQVPQSLRIVNTGTSDIWLWITATSQTAAFPVAGTTTVGTPAGGLRLRSGVVEVFVLSAVGANVGGTQPPTAGAWFNNVSTGVSQSFDVTPGEGL